MTLSPVERKWPGNGKNGILDFGGYIDMSQKKNYILQKKKEKKKKQEKTVKKKKKKKKKTSKFTASNIFADRLKTLSYSVFSCEIQS